MSFVPGKSLSREVGKNVDQLSIFDSKYQVSTFIIFLVENQDQLREEEEVRANCVICVRVVGGRAY